MAAGGRWPGASPCAASATIALLSGASAHELPFGRIMAASVVVAVLVAVLVLVFQRYIVSGLTAGALKE